MTLQTAVLDGNAAAAHSAAATGLIETVADHAGLGPAVPVFLSSLGIRGHRQTDGGEKCRYQRHHLGLEPNASRRTQPVFDTAIDQQEQDTPHYSGRPSGHQPAPSGSRRHNIDEELLHRRVGALPARQGRQHLADIFTAQPQDAENAATFRIGFERLHPLTDCTCQLIQRIEAESEARRALRRLAKTSFGRSARLSKASKISSLLLKCQ